MSWAMFEVAGRGLVAVQAQHVVAIYDRLYDEEGSSSCRQRLPAFTC